MKMYECHGCLTVTLVVIHFFCSGPADHWLHHPSVQGGREGGSRHEEDPLCIPTEVHLPSESLRLIYNSLINVHTPGRAMN